MRLLLRRAESGRLLFTEDTGDGFRALVRSIPAAEVSIDPDGDVHIRFNAVPDPPVDSDPDASVCAVVLAFRDRPPGLEGADLSVELRDAAGAVGRTSVPPGRAFVSFAVGCHGPAPLQLTASITGARTPLDGAALLELGGAQLEPLLIRYRSQTLTGTVTLHCQFENAALSTNCTPFPVPVAKPSEKPERDAQGAQPNLT